MVNKFITPNIVNFLSLSFLWSCEKRCVLCGKKTIFSTKKHFKKSDFLFMQNSLV